MTNRNTPTADVREELIRLIWGDADAMESVSIEAAADAILTAFEVRPYGTVTDPNLIPDEVADESQLAFHEFVWGPENWPTKRELGISRQAWKCALAVAFDRYEKGEV